MVSLRRSHCHSASETFIGRPCSRTRSRTLRRTSSSARRSCSAACTSSRVARRRMRRVAFWSAASWREQPAQPRPHFFRATSPSADTRPKSWPRSASTITGSCGANGSADCQVKYSSRFPLNRTSMTGCVNSLLGESAYRKVLLFPPLEELRGSEPHELAQVTLQRRGEARRRRFRVGVRPAGRLRDDLVDDAQRQLILGREL